MERTVCQGVEAFHTVKRLGTGVRGTCCGCWDGSNGCMMVTGRAVPAQFAHQSSLNYSIRQRPSSLQVMMPTMSSFINGLRKNGRSNTHQPTSWHVVGRRCICSEERPQGHVDAQLCCTVVVAPVYRTVRRVVLAGHRRFPRDGGCVDGDDRHASLEFWMVHHRLGLGSFRTFVHP